MNKRKEYITVFSADIAKKLLYRGYTIADLKKDKQDPDGKKTVFVFNNDTGFEHDLQKIVNERRNVH